MHTKWRTGSASQPVWNLGEQKSVVHLLVLNRETSVAWPVDCSPYSVNGCALDFLVPFRYFKIEWMFSDESVDLVLLSKCASASRRNSRPFTCLSIYVYSRRPSPSTTALQPTLFKLTLRSLPAILYGRWREANICFVPDLTSYRTPTSHITVFILAQLPFLFFSFLSFIIIFFSPHQEFLVLGQWGRSGGPWRGQFVSDY